MALRVGASEEVLSKARLLGSSSLAMTLDG